MKKVRLDLKDAKEMLDTCEEVGHDECGHSCPGKGTKCTPYLDPLRKAIEEAERG